MSSPAAFATCAAMHCSPSGVVQDRRDNPGGRYSGAVYLVHAGVPVWIDDGPAIAHNKVVILDGRTVITGSFNFSKAADTRNAENVVVIESETVAGPASSARIGKRGEPCLACSRQSSTSAGFRTAHQSARPARQDTAEGSDRSALRVAFT